MKCMLRDGSKKFNSYTAAKNIGYMRSELIPQQGCHIRCHPPRLRILGQSVFLDYILFRKAVMVESLMNHMDLLNA